jgi:hypothetical protein
VGPILLNVLDDMGTGIVYGDDLVMRDKLPTAPVMTTDIPKELGWLWEPSMGHYCVDNVWKDLAAAADCLTYVPDAVIEHMHWTTGKAPMDRTYEEAGTFSTDHPDWAAYQSWKTERMAKDVARVRSLWLP